MNVLRVISSMDPRAGGPSQGIRHSIPALADLGCHTEVVCLDDPAAHFLGDDPFPIHALGSGRTSWCYQPALAAWLREHLPRFDAAILHGLWQYPGYALRKAAEGLEGRPPYYIFPHGMLDPWFQKAPGRRMKAARNWLYWKALEQRTVREAAALLFTCAEEERLAAQTFAPYQPRQTWNVGYGLPSPPPETGAMKEAFHASLPALPAGQPYLLFLSRLHAKKGADLLIQTYGEMARAGGLPLPHLVIAGPGLEEEHGRSLQALAIAHCPPGTVHFPGMLVGAAKWGALYGCEAFVLPSHQENFGIAVVEALACGAPVLISNQINIWREIEGAGAALVEDDNRAGTARLLTRWRELPEAGRSGMRAAAVTCARARFGIGPAAERLIKVLRGGAQ